MRVMFSSVLLPVFVLLVESVSPQPAQPHIPSAAAHLVRVKIGDSGGMCGGPGYCATLTTVEPFFIISESTNSRDKNDFPDRKTKTEIAKGDWQNLERAVDAKALVSAQQAVCKGMLDLPCSWLEVEFSDSTRIDFSYDPTDVAAPVAAVLRQVRAIHLPLQSLQAIAASTSGIPDAAAAKARAEALLAAKKWNFPPFTAKLKEGIWTVMGTVRCQEALPRTKFACYGGAGVRLRKSDGSVVELIPPRHD